VVERAMLRERKAQTAQVSTVERGGRARRRTKSHEDHSIIQWGVSPTDVP
jgi:hypothetical protein